MYSKKAKKTALIVVDMLKCLTVEGGYNYYPTAKEMIEDGYDDKIRQMRDHGCLVVWVGSALQHRSGYTATPHEINPELAGRSLAGDRGWIFTPCCSSMALNTAEIPTTLPP